MNVRDAERAAVSMKGCEGVGRAAAHTRMRQPPRRREEVGRFLPNAYRGGVALRLALGRAGNVAEGRCQVSFQWGLQRGS